MAPGSPRSRSSRAATAPCRRTRQAGIHSHADFLIHDHPFASDEAGKKATLGRYLGYAQSSVSSDSIRLWSNWVPNVDYTNGDKCKDSGKPGELQWKVGKLGEPWPTKAETGNPSDHHIGNGEIIALYFVPKGTKLEQPPGSDEALKSISDLSGQPRSPRPCADDVSRRCPPRSRPRDHDVTCPPPRQAAPAPTTAVKAVVLVGGTGTRLRPLTYTTPKPLLPIANIPFVERQLDWLASYGVDEAVLSLGYLPDAFTRHFADERHGDMKLRFVVEHEPLGTAGGIRFAAEGINERLIVCNGDVLTDLDLGAFVAFHEERGAEATISLTQVDDPSAFGVVPTRADGEVIAFVEKPPRDQAPTNWINAGHLRARAVGARVDPAPPQRVDRARDVPADARAARAASTPRGPTATGSTSARPGKYFEAQLDVLAGRVGPTPTPTAVETAPGVWVEPDAVVDAGAVLEAPVLVGARRARRPPTPRSTGASSVPTFGSAPARACGTWSSSTA